MISPHGFLLDEHLRGPLWEAIQAHNSRPEVEAIRAYRVGDWPAPSLGTDDPDLLLWAEREGRLLGFVRPTNHGQLFLGAHQRR